MHSDKYQPVVSIVVPVHNESAKTIRCFASIRANTHMPYEIIWVDNGSSPDHFGKVKRQAMKPRVHTKLIRFKKNVGFVRATNAGIKEVEKSSKYIVLLNNDTEVCWNVLLKLTTPLDDKEVGAVGPITQSKISWQEAEHLNMRWGFGLPKFPNGKGANPKLIRAYSDLLTKKFSDRYVPVDKLPLSFFCVAMRKDTVEKVGLLDEAFGFGLGDDDEYCFRLRAHNLKLMLSLETFIYHWHRSTFRSLKIPVDKLRRKNIRILREKKKETMERISE